MAISNEDNKDVKKAFGKPVARAIKMATQDSEDAAERKMLARLKTKSKGMNMTRRILG